MLKVEPEHLISSVDGLLARLEEHRLSSWDVPPSFEQYIKEIRVVDFVRAASANQAVATGSAPILEESKSAMTERVEPT